MAFRVVLIENDVSVKIQLDNIVVNNGEREVWIPIDDVSIMILDNLKISISTRMLSSLADNNVAIIICDQKHLPKGLYSSYENHSRVSKCIGFQINRDSIFYDEMWKNITQSKIENQAQMLEKHSKNKHIIIKIRELRDEVNVGDTDNREAHAAKIYFNELMETSYSRGNPDILINSGLDYGYTIVRSYLARLCVAYGLNTQLGIHHRSEYNRFNLVDDLIEPIRPIVDDYIYDLLIDEAYFMPEHRHKIINFLNHKIKYNNKKMFMCNMMEEYVSSIAAFIMGKDKKIEYPQLNNYLGEVDEV